MANTARHSGRDPGDDRNLCAANNYCRLTGGNDEEHPHDRGMRGRPGAGSRVRQLRLRGRRRHLCAVLPVRTGAAGEARAVGRHAPAHLAVARCAGLRRPARPRVRVPLRPGRGSRRHFRAAGAAVPAARLPGDRGSLGRPGRDERDHRGQPGAARRPDHPPLARDDQGRRRLGVPGLHGRRREAHQRSRAGGTEEQRGIRPLDLGALHPLRGQVQRAGPVHGAGRLRVDLDARRQQPAPRRDLPGRCRQGQPPAALHDGAERGPRGPLEGTAPLRGSDGWAGAGDRAQRQPIERADVLALGLRGEADHARLCRAAHALGARV